jgi:large conductance mechanosensitive channel
MKIINEFKEFINRGNVMDMAVGIIIGAAFTAIVTSLVDDLIQPFIVLLTGGNAAGVSNLAIPVAGTENGIDFGAFISAIINFLIIAWVVFMLIKGLNKLQSAGGAIRMKVNKNGEEVIETKPVCPFCLEEVNEGATRCSHCAAELPEPAVTTVEVVTKD